MFFGADPLWSTWLSRIPNMVPLLDVNAQNSPIEGELAAVFQQVSRHGWFILGPEVKAFEAEAAEFLGVDHAIGVSSGTDALLLALMALGIGPGDEVLCPSFTFYATAGAVSRVGATPVFVDSCPVCFNIDVEDARKKITGQTRVILPVHLFGSLKIPPGVNSSVSAATAATRSPSSCRAGLRR